MHHTFGNPFFFTCIIALGLVGCSENTRVSIEAPDATPPAVSSATVAPSAEPPPTPLGTESVASPEPAPEPEPAVDIASIERRFLSATNDPAARIAAVQALADATPAAALIQLNRLFAIEHREDVKSKMLAVLSDLDHAQNRDDQLAFCIKALAPSQPMRVRYIAIHTLADLGDPRARGFLIPLQRDSDREIRAAATQALSDLAQ